MKIAVMQPYFFPYIGYFQLINTVDKFVFYDDVNFIKGGWINRNRILINKKPAYINAPLKGASSFKKINQIVVDKNFTKVLRTIKQNYSKAPYFKRVYPIIESLLMHFTENTISKLAGQSVISIANYLNIEVSFEYSSEKYHDTLNLERADRLIEICNRNKANTYINPIGGSELYSKKYFMGKGIELKFIESKQTEYQQLSEEFIPNLSIIDVVMFNDIERIKKKILKNYELR